MDPVEKCVRCGSPIQGQQLGGLCHRCVANALFTGLEQSDHDDDLTTVRGRVSPARSTPFALDDQPDEAVGQTIGRYKLREKIGEGGCGVVYVAEQTEPVRRRVALKLIKLGMDTKQVVARFEAERQALAMMDHPNIAKVLDAGTTEGQLSSPPDQDAPISAGRPYFVMELVPGIKITDFCDQNHLSIRERLDLFIKVCHAIQHAHQKGIIHRDIKPSNVLVTLHDDEPVPKVIDFGIAKATEGRLTDATIYTQMQQFIGTPAYMSPEQAMMSGLDIDTRSDIYSLGVLLYELLAGDPPFDEKELRSMGLEAMCATIREKEPIRPSTKLRTLPGEGLTTTAKRRASDLPTLMRQLRGDLDWIVMTCLEKDRKRRYETANGLAADIHRHLNNEPVVARPPTFTYRFQKAFRRNKGAFAATAAVLGALMIGLIIALWSLNEANLQRNEANSRAKALERRVYLVHLANADKALLERDFQRTRLELEACPSAQRGWEWMFLEQRMKNTVPLALPGWQKPIFTRDGRRLIAAGVGGGRDENKVKIWDAESGQLLQELKHESEGQMISVALSPNERHLAGGAQDGSLTLWDLETTMRIWTVHEHTDRFDGLAYSPDGRWIATANHDRTVKVFAASNGAVRCAQSFDHSVRGVSFSSDSQSVAAGFGNGQEHPVLISVATGEIVQRFAHDGAEVPVFSPDGRWIATGDQKGRISAWKRDGQKWVEAESWPAFESRILSLDFNADGSRLACSSYDGVKVLDVEAHEEIALIDAGTLVSWLTMHPTKDRVAIFVKGDLGIQVRDFGQKDPSVIVESTHHSPVQSVQFSPDGEWIAAGSHPVRFGDEETSAPVRILEAGSGKIVNTMGTEIRHFAWMPNSRSLAVAHAGGNQNLEIRQAITGEVLNEFSGFADWVWPFVSPNGSLTITTVARDFAVRQWDVRSGKWEKEFHMDQKTVPGFVTASPRGRWVAASFGQTYRVEIWDAATGEMAHTIPMQGRIGINLPLFTKDESSLYAGGERGILTLHDINTGEEIKRFIGHSDSIVALALSPDEKQLVSSDSQRVIVWDVESTMPLVTLEDQSRVTSLDWSPDNKRIVAGRSDGSVQIWNLPTAQGQP